LRTVATELYEDVAPVLGPISSFNQFLSGEPINQLDGGMVSDLELFGEPFDRE
jgi:hypothetical protein